MKEDLLIFFVSYDSELGFGLLVEQKKQLVDATLGSGESLIVNIFGRFIDKGKKIMSCSPELKAKISCSCKTTAHAGAV